jgi:hypothetical protein
LSATLTVTQPAGLVAAVVVAWAGAAVMRRTARRAGSPPAARRPGFSFVESAGFVLALAVATLLAGANGPLAQFTLGLLALAAGAWLVTELYRREALAPRARWLLAGTRGLAWAALLVLLARPAWTQTLLTWDKPVLAVLLDQSQSMSLVDAPGPSPAAPARAARANAAFAAASREIARLSELYDIRLRGVGAHSEPVSSWEITPQAPLTGLAGALREAREFRSVAARPPVAVLLVSDGAENVVDAAALRQAAADLAQEGTALLGIGVGPEPGRAPLVELDPLVVPPRVTARDLLRVSASGRAQGCRGQAVQMEVLWDENVAATRAIPGESDTQPFAPEFELVPPGPGAHRLAVRATLPAVLGGQTFMTATIVDVTSDRTRVLYLERVPRAEAAFAMRAWRADPQIEVTSQFLFDPGRSATDPRGLADLFAAQDVIVLGDVGTALPAAVVDALAQAVTQRGAGLLLAGGPALLNVGQYAKTPLADLCPTQWADREFGLPDRPRFRPTEAGLQHAVLMPEADGRGQPPAAALGQVGATWLRLPTLDRAAALGGAKPAAVVLATDDNGRPLLAAQEVGRGRCLVAAWEETWPWALASDEGRVLHERLWRQMAVWLANRRPCAWVVTDQLQYALAALTSGEQRVHVRAGVSALGALPAGSRSGSEHASLTLARTGPPDDRQPPVELPLNRTGDGWSVEIPNLTGQGRGLVPAAYVLEFSVPASGRPATSEPADPDLARATGLTARARFTVVAENLEQRAPTANLTLLRTAAEQTASCGGRYVDVSGLANALAELTRTDRRERVARPVRYDLLESAPWTLLVWLACAASLEWFLRKRAGLT